MTEAHQVNQKGHLSMSDHGEVFEMHASLSQLTEDERFLLREHEATARFTLVPYAGLSEGRQSRVSVLAYEVSGTTHHVLWKRMGVGKGLSHREAEESHDRLRPYRGQLRSAGWNIPRLYYTAPVQVGREWQIFSYEQLISGGDAEAMVANPEEPNFRKWDLLRQVVEILAAYDPSTLRRVSLAGQSLTGLPHGLDLKLANLVLNDSLYFVDLFGIKELTPAGQWRIYLPKLDSLSPDSLMAVCATREGALLRFYRLAESSWSGTGSIDPSYLRGEFLGILHDAGLPGPELHFITDEVTRDFPWLDTIYSERQV